jgi:hypothetical protein
MGLFNDIDPIFFYHKSVKPLLAMGFNGVVTPSGGKVRCKAFPSGVGCIHNFVPHRLGEYESKSRCKE